MIPVRLFLFLVIVLVLPARAADSKELTSAIALFDAKRVPEARAELAALVAREPKNIRALWYLGRSELAMQRREDAAATLGKAAELAPGDHRILADYGSASLLRATELGASFSAIGHARRGRTALEQAVKLSPDTVAYREGLVQFYTRAPGFAGGSFDKVCENFIIDHPDNYLALYTLGRIASETGLHLARGETALRRCLQLTPRIEEPDHAGAHYRLGMIAEKASRPADARRDYQAALALEPVFPEASAALARLK